jgi:hypothetical protein
VITPRGVEALLADCEAVSAYHGDDYLRLVHRFYASHRKALFDFARQFQFEVCVFTHLAQELRCSPGRSASPRSSSTAARLACLRPPRAWSSTCVAS